MELFGKIADLCQALVVLLLVFQVSALFRSVDRLRRIRKEGQDGKQEGVGRIERLRGWHVRP